MLKPLTLIILSLLLGCESQPASSLDADRILHMAGEEAGQIASPRERLTRQLNIANRETETGKPGNALNTLALARKTLEQAEKNALTDQERLSGWISVCELARGANDKAFAGAALDQAFVALNQLAPDPARCEYVPGIEREVRAVRGDAAAAMLLRTAADWAMDLPEQPRRASYFAFAEELFRCNDYEGARLVLRHEKDAAWRSDTLMAMSDSARGANMKAAGGWFNPMAVTAIQVRSADAEPTTAPAPVFFKSLDFKSNYYRP